MDLYDQLYKVGLANKDLAKTIAAICFVIMCGMALKSFGTQNPLLRSRSYSAFQSHRQRPQYESKNARTIKKGYPKGCDRIVQQQALTLGFDLLLLHASVIYLYGKSINNRRSKPPSLQNII